jgi:DNA-binding response OmpR family regulator
VLVEDDPHHADLITEALGTARLANPIVRLQSGHAALEYFFQSVTCDQPRFDTLHDCPCLIILDLRLPDMEGLDVLKRLKKNRLLELIPVMILSTSANERDIKRGFDLRANAYVTKPVAFQEFCEKVRQAGIYWVMVNEPVPV